MGLHYKIKIGMKNPGNLQLPRLNRQTILYVKVSTFVNEHVDNASEGNLIQIISGAAKRRENEPLTRACDLKPYSKRSFPCHI